MPEIFQPTTSEMHLPVDYSREITEEHYPINPNSYFVGIKKEKCAANALQLEIDSFSWLLQLKTYDTDGSKVDDQAVYGIPNRLGNYGEVGSGGVPYASMQLSDLINGSGQGRKHEKQLRVNSLDRYGYVVGESLLPREQYDMLIATAPNEGLRQLAELMKSATYPNENIPEGTPVLPPRPIHEVNDVIKSRSQEMKGMYCGQAEVFFLQDSYALDPVMIDGKIIAYQKETGENTALLAEPAVLNGVLLPKGSLLTVGEDDSGNRTFAFARLTVLALPPQELESAMPYFVRSDGFQSQVSSLEQIQRLLNAEQEMPTIASLKQYQSELSAYLDADQQMSQIVNILRSNSAKLLKQPEFELAMDELGEQAKKFRVEPSETPTKENLYRQNAIHSAIYEQHRTPAKNPKLAYRNTLKYMINTFGIGQVNEARRLIRDSDIVERILAVAIMKQKLNKYVKLN